MGYVANFIGFPAVQKFWKSIVIWKSWRHFKGGNFIETQCISHTTSDNSISILVPTRQQEPYAFLVCRVAPQQRFGINIITNINIKRILWNQVKWELRLCPTGRPKKRRDDGTDDGTLSQPWICKPLHGPWKKSDEAGDWTDNATGLLHVIRLHYSIFSGGQTSTLS